MTLYKGEYRIESARLPAWDDASRGWYFVTICTQGHQCILGRIVEGQIILSDLGMIARRELEKIPGHYDNVELGCWVVMPNHVHAIVVIGGEHIYSPCIGRQVRNISGNFPQSGSLSAIVRSYKSAVARKCRLAGWEFSWQPRFYDRILRSNASVNAVGDYILKNPQNWEKDPDRRV